MSADLQTKLAKMLYENLLVHSRPPTAYVLMEALGWRAPYPLSHGENSAENAKKAAAFLRNWANEIEDGA